MEEPRGCWPLKRLKSESRDDLLLMRIEPALIGQKYGLGDKDVDVVIVATRHKGDSLFPINEWPVSVHVARPLVANPELRAVIRDDETELIAWAELYPTEAAARTKVM